ncbi:phosphatidylserine decarboxylase-domain-containing protein [Crassisporium funariophilum]|nr:phosphatidylserine decarboxylase-domain-containing protein [Crassisporium funariophilum]
MTSLNKVNVDKPIEKIHPGNLPGAGRDDIANALKTLVDHSSTNSNVHHLIHAPMQTIEKLPWVHSLIPGIEKLAVEYHTGNFVAMRGESEPFFESMPLYARLGMHLLFYGKEQARVLGTQRVEELLEEQSVKQGAIYDSPQSAAAIPSFVQTYSIHTDELLEPDLSKYKTFNEFFSRKVRPDARPVQGDELVVCSAADCRLTVYESFNAAKTFWVKGKNFNIPSLLNVQESSPTVDAFQDSSLAIFRLAPADYHRFHSPIDCEIGDIENIPGHLYTVNPQAVNEPGFDVLTANTRSVLYLKHVPTGLPVAFVAIGALLVGSINWTGGKEKGSKLNRGDELGYFAYGGSTIVVVFPKELIKFDDDLVQNSQKPIETLVKVCLQPTA